MSDGNSNSVRSFKEESVMFILSLLTLYFTMNESSITWQSRDYESSLFIKSVRICSHTLHELSTFKYKIIIFLVCLETYSMDLKIVSSDKIEFFELYNFVVHLVYIL